LKAIQTMQASTATMPVAAAKRAGCVIEGSPK
jgi:hypothetical protein